jgi:hypothetical protein
MKRKRKPDDRLGFARDLLLVSWLASGTALSLMLLDSSLRPSLREEPACALVNTLSLSNLSVLPSGRPARHPEALHDAVNLRFSPLLPPVETDPAFLLVSGPEHSGHPLSR